MPEQVFLQNRNIVLEFPDGTPDDVIQQTIKREYPMTGEEVAGHMMTSPDWFTDEMTLDEYERFREWKSEQDMSVGGFAGTAATALGQVGGEVLKSIGQLIASPIDSASGVPTAFEVGTRDIWNLGKQIKGRLAKTDDTYEDYLDGRKDTPALRDAYLSELSDDMKADREMISWFSKERERIISESDNPDFVRGASNVLDPTVFFGGFLGKSFSKAAAKASQKVIGDAATTLGSGMARTGDTLAGIADRGAEAFGQGFTKATGVTPETGKALAYSTGIGGTVASGAAVPLAAGYGAIRGMQLGGRVLAEAGEGVHRGIGREGFFGGAAARLEPGSGAQRLATGLSYADPLLEYGARAAGGAAAGGAFGMGLGALADGWEGAASGLGGGIALGGLGGGIHRGLEGLTGVALREKRAADVRNYLGSLSGGDRAKFEAFIERRGQHGTDEAANILDTASFIRGMLADDTKEVRTVYVDDASSGLRGQVVSLTESDGVPTITVNLAKAKDGYSANYTMGHELWHAMSKIEQLSPMAENIRREIAGLWVDGKVLEEGMLPSATLGKYFDDYVKKLPAKEQRAIAEKHASLQSRAEYVADEIAAEHMAALVTGGTKGRKRYDTMLKAFDTPTQKALDAIVLRNSGGVLGRMATRLSEVGFAPGKSFLFPDMDKASPVLNAMMRDMIRARKNLNERIIATDETFNGKKLHTAIRKQDFKHFQKELDNLGLLKDDGKGGKVMKDDKEIAADEEASDQAVRDILKAGGEGGMRIEVTESGEEVVRGTRFTPEQISAIQESATVLPTTKRNLAAFNEAVESGSIMDMTYYAATRRTKSRLTGNYTSKYSSGIKRSRREVLPYSVKLSAAGNLYVRAVDWTTLWSDTATRAMSGKLSAWDNNHQAFLRDFKDYLDNLSGLTPERSAARFGRDKADFMHDLLTAQHKGGGKYTKSFRLDRMDGLTPTGERAAMSEQAYQMSKARWMPDEGAAEAAPRAARSVKVGSLSVFSVPYKRTVIDKKSGKSTIIEKTINVPGRTAAEARKSARGKLGSMLKKKGGKLMSVLPATKISSFDVLEMQGRRSFSIPGADKVALSPKDTKLKSAGEKYQEAHGQIDYGADYAKTLEHLGTSPEEWQQVMPLMLHGTKGVTPPAPTRLAEWVSSPASFEQFVRKSMQDNPQLLESAVGGLRSLESNHAAAMQGKIPARMVASHMMWGILSRMLDPFNQEAGWARLVSSPDVLRVMDDSIAGNYKMTPDQWKKIVDTTLKEFPDVVEGNNAKQNANAFHAMLSKWNGRWQELAGIINNPELSGRDMRRQFFERGFGGAGIKHKVLSFVIATLARRDVFIGDRWQVVNMWFPHLRKTAADHGREVFKYDKKGVPEDTTGAYSLIGGLLNNESTGEAVYTVVENALTKIGQDSSGWLAGILGHKPNAFDIHWVTWNIIKREPVGHSSLDATSQFLREGLYEKPDFIERFAGTPKSTERYNYDTGGYDVFTVERLGQASRSSRGLGGDTGSNPIADAGGHQGRPAGLDARQMPDDSSYLDAANRGDTATAQRMVDQAAKAAGYTIPATHRTATTGIKVFDHGIARDELGRRMGLGLGAGKFYFSGGRTGFINPDKPVNVEAYLKVLNPISEKAYKAIVAEEGGVKDMADLPGGSPERDAAIAKADAKVKAIGHDGIVQDYRDPDGRVVEYGQIAVFDPNQIKSADPITYDDAGNIIPLSERFQSGSDDIRYMPDAAMDALPSGEGAVEKRVAIPRRGRGGNVPEMSEIRAALSDDRKPKVGVGDKLKAGDPVGLRIDIPAFERTLENPVSKTGEPTYAVSVHGKWKGKKGGGAGTVVGYENLVRVKNPVFMVNEKAAAGIRGGKAKSTIATVEGAYVKSKAIPSDISNWTQVGMNPKRHSYFYDRATGEPVVGGTEALSVGGTVFVKDAEFGSRGDFRFMPDIGPAPQRADDGWIFPNGKFLSLGGLDHEGAFNSWANKNRNNSYANQVLGLRNDRVIKEDGHPDEPVRRKDILKAGIVRVVREGDGVHRKIHAQGNMNRTQKAALERMAINSERSLSHDPSLEQHGEGLFYGRSSKLIYETPKKLRFNKERESMRQEMVDAGLIRFQPDIGGQDSLGMFSAAERATVDLKQEKGSASQMLAMIKKAGVKDEEIAELGLDKFLEGNRKVSKDEIVDYLVENQITVEETVLGGESPAERQLTLQEAEDAIRGYHTIELRKEGERAGQVSSQWGLDQVKDDPGITFHGQPIPAETKHPSYVEPGAVKGSYRELLLRLPEKPLLARQAFSDFTSAMQKKYGIDSRYLGDLEDRPESPLSPSERAIYNKLETDMLNGPDRVEPYTGGHYGEHPNVLAHVRFNDRTSEYGKTLFIEEIQSDWHQDGRKKGYQLSESEMRALKDEIKIRGEWQSTYIQTRQYGDHAWLLDNDSVYRENYNKLREANHRLESGRVPDAPFKTSWHELSMKRMISYAAKNGYDAIAWTKGETQANRYSLSKQVDEIHHGYKTMVDGAVVNQVTAIKGPIMGDHSPTGGGQTLLNVFIKEDGTVARGEVATNDVTGKHISDIVGKEIAEKIMRGDSTGPAPFGGKKLSGEDLKVGGEGMKGFYDRMLPKMKTWKKLGLKVESGDLGGEPGNYDNVNAHIVKLTPEVKAKVLDTGIARFMPDASVPGAEKNSIGWSMILGKTGKWRVYDPSGALAGVAGSKAVAERIFKTKYKRELRRERQLVK